MNTFRTGLLLAALTGLFLAVGYVLGGEGGMLVALALALGMNVFAYWNADKLLLRMYGARQVTKAAAPTLLGIVEQLAPVAAMLVPMAISRSREYDADRLGAEISGRPLWLAPALEKLDRLARRIGNPRAESNPATAHLLIVNPLRGRNVNNLFRTHPATANRIRRPREMAGVAGPWG